MDAENYREDLIQAMLWHFAHGTEDCDEFTILAEEYDRVAPVQSKISNFETFEQKENIMDEQQLNEYLERINDIEDSSVSTVSLP